MRMREACRIGGNQSWPVGLGQISIGLKYQAKKFQPHEIKRMGDH